jgi:tetratricopeptide (TPR) repeat protein
MSIVPVTWRSRALFLSSTFLDMHAERDHLRAHVYPALAERLRDRCHYLDTIDLRQGVETPDIADEAAKEIRILQVCIAEIERSRPFFVCLLGDRYGYVPPPERMQAAARDAGFQHEIAGRSVTELEVRYGVLDNPDQLGRSWFYFRELDTTGMPNDLRARFDERHATDAGAPGRWQALLELKARIRAEVPDRVRTYRAQWDPRTGHVTGFDDLARLVHDDLWNDLDIETREHLRAASRTWQDVARRELDDFVENRIRCYCERQVVTTPLIDHASSALGGPWAICLTGEPGAGKSSIFGSVYRTLQTRDDFLVLAHAVGISVGTDQVDRVLRRWVQELAGFLSLDDPLADLDGPSMVKPEQRVEGPGARPVSDRIDDAFADLLRKAAQRVRVVVMLDAIDQFEATERTRYLTWLPQTWPDNARLIATAVPGPASGALLERDGAAEHPIRCLSESEAAEIANRFSRERYHHDVNGAALARLVAKTLPDLRPAHANPLWLQLAIEELNLLEADDFEVAESRFANLQGGDRMQALLVHVAESLPADVPGIYGCLLERAELHFGREWCRAVVNAIAISRSGWREDDLRAIVPAFSGLPWDDLAFAGLRRALGGHLVRRGAQAQWDFFHTQLRSTVLARNLPEQRTRQVLHGKVADHLESLPTADAMRASETMHHLYGLAAPLRAALYMASLQPLSEERHGAAAILSRAIATVQPSGSGVSPLDWLVACSSVQPLEEDALHAAANLLLFEVSNMLAVDARNEAERLQLLNIVRATLERVFVSGSATIQAIRDLSVSWLALGDLHRDLGQVEKALEFYQGALAIAKELHQRAPQIADYARDLGVSYERLGYLHRESSQAAQAIEFYHEALAIAEDLHQRNPRNVNFARDLGLSHEHLGELYLGLGQGAQALEFYQRALAIAEELLQSNPHNADFAIDLVGIDQRLGDLHHGLGQGTEALEFYQKALVIAEGLHRRNPQNAGFARGFGVSCERLGDLYLGLGQGAQALEFYQRALAIAEELHQRNPHNVNLARDRGASYGKRGDLHRGLGQGTEALEFYQRALAIAEELHQRYPANADSARGLAWVYQRLGDLYRGLGQDAEALEFYEKALAIAEDLHQRNPQSVDFARSLSVSHSKLGDLHRGLGQDAEALEFYKKALAIAEDLHQRSPENADFASGLGVSYERLGDLYLGLGQDAQALEFHQKALTIVEELRHRNPQSAELARQLSNSHWAVGMAMVGSRPTTATLHVFASYCTLSGLIEEDRHPDERAVRLLEQLRQLLAPTGLLDEADAGLRSALTQLGHDYYVHALAVMRDGDHEEAARHGSLAIMWLRRALLLLTPDTDLQGYITVGCDLAGVLVDFGSTESELEESADTATALLAVIPPGDDDAAFNRAATMTNLGHALYRLGVLRVRSDMIEEGLGTLVGARDCLRAIENKAASTEVEILIQRARSALTGIGGSRTS